MLTLILKNFNERSQKDFNIVKMSTSSKLIYKFNVMAKNTKRILGKPLIQRFAQKN